MPQQTRSYRCNVCRWHGVMEPIDAGDAAPCPQCGVYLYPMSWFQTWGLALILVACTVLLVLIAARAKW